MHHLEQCLLLFDHLHLKRKSKHPSDVKHTFMDTVLVTHRSPQADIQISTVAIRGLPLVIGRKKLCHCRVRVLGCTAVLLSTQARGSCSTGSVQRDGGKQDTERGRVDARWQHLCECAKRKRQSVCMK